MTRIMRKSTWNGLSALAKCFILSTAGVCVVYGELPCWAPDISMHFCIDLPNNVHSSCSQPLPNKNETRCTTELVWERNKFPIDRVSSATGVTTEERHNCHRVVDCVWDYDEEECLASGTHGEWQKADKIVVDHSKTCPQS